MHLQEENSTATPRRQHTGVTTSPHNHFTTYPPSVSFPDDNCMPIRICVDVATQPPVRGQSPALSPPGQVACGPVDEHEKALGTLTKSRNPPPALQRWKLQGIAAKLLPAERVANCLRKRISVATDVMIVRGDGHTHYAGLQYCGSVWSCPICAAKVGKARHDELQQAIDNAQAQGYHVFLFTLTAPHKLQDSLDSLLPKLTQARRLFRNRKTWKRLAKKWGLVGTITDKEALHGANGWHVHFHELLIVKAGSRPDKDFRELLEAWRSACEDAGLARPNNHGLDIRGGRSAAGYVSKWGCAEEITLHHSKVPLSLDSLTPWGLLARAGEGSDYHAGLFLDFFRNFKGRRQLHWSKGLRDLLDLGEEISDEDIAGKVTPDEVVLRIPVQAWGVVLHYNARAILLHLAHDYGEDIAEEFLAVLVIRYISDRFQFSPAPPG